MKMTRIEVASALPRSRVLKLVCCVALWALLSSVVLAQGSITGVTVAPAQAAIGQEVAVAIASTDNTVCAELQIGFGDGTGTVLKNQPLVPGFQLKHQYQKAGTFTVMVRAINGCSGFAKAVVTIKASSAATLGKLGTSKFGKQQSNLAELCAKVDCTGAISKEKPKIDFGTTCLQPEIKGQFLGKIAPGGVIAVKGCGFRSAPGEILLGLSQPPFHTIALEVIEWKDGLIGARIRDETPFDSGVIDQPAFLLVRTKDDKQSNKWKVNFEANKTIIPLPPGALNYDCSDEADHNRCHSESGNNASFYGYHGTTGMFEDSDIGWDEFNLTLKNGWTFESMTFDKYLYKDYGYESWVQYPTGFSFGSSSVKLKVKWKSDDTVNYWGYLYVIGPVGVPYK